MNINKKIIILVSICVIVLVGALVADGIMGKTYLNKIKYTEIIEKIENGDSFVFIISQTNCNHCASFKPKMEKVAKKYKLNVYYIDVDLLGEDEKTKLKSYVNYEGTPATIFIKNGKESSAATRINGDASIEKIENKLKSNGFIE